MKHNKCLIPSLLPLLCGGKVFEMFAIKVMHLKVILPSTGVGRDSAVGTDTLYGFGGPGIECR